MMSERSSHGKIVLCTFLLFATYLKGLYSQTDAQLPNINSFSEDVLQEQGLDVNAYSEQLYLYQQNPVNLNKANEEDLYLLPFLSDREVQSLLTYRDEYGPLISIYELQAVPLFTVQKIKQIIPYVAVQNQLNNYFIDLKPLLFSGKQEIVFRYAQTLPLAEEYKTNVYAGNASKLYIRYRYRHGNQLSYGFTAEKDAGEPFFSSMNRIGFDFYSFHFFLRKRKWMHALALGDYSVNLGQGLILWSGFGVGKSALVTHIKKSGHTLAPYASTHENRFYRGIGLSTKIRSVEATLFASMKPLDARILHTDSSDVERINIQTSGLHRTLAEINAKHNLLESKLGANIAYKQSSWHVGVSVVQTLLNKQQAFSTQLYGRFGEFKKSATHVSIDYHALWKQFHFFGENAISRSDNKHVGYALLQGILFSPDPTIGIGIVYRSYDKKYIHTQYANAFGESSSMSGENGLYIGVELTPHGKFSFSGYIDLYRHRWLQFQTSKPAKGFDYLFQATFKPTRSLELTIRYKDETKEKNTRIELEDDRLMVNKKNEDYIVSYFGAHHIQQNHLSERTIEPSSSLSKSQIESATFITPHTLRRFRVNLIYRLHKAWHFQSRIEWSWHTDQINPLKKGMLLFQDLRFAPVSFPLSFSARWSFFDIQDFDASIYAYENDLLYQFSVPSFNHQGLRYYLNIRYKLGRYIRLGVRFAHTHYLHLNTTRSNSTTSEENKKTEIKTQIRILF